MTEKEFHWHYDKLFHGPELPGTDHRSCLPTGRGLFNATHVSLSLDQYDDLIKAKDELVRLQERWAASGATAWWEPHYWKDRKCWCEHNENHEESPLVLHKSLSSQLEKNLQLVEVQKETILKLRDDLSKIYDIASHNAHMGQNAKAAT